MTIVRLDFPASAISNPIPVYPVYHSDLFVNSVGMNIRLHHDDTLYVDDFSRTKDLLMGLHIRHVRDGMIQSPAPWYVERHNELALRTLFISSLSGPVQDYPYTMFNCFASYEAPNEPNISGDPNWVYKTKNCLYLLRKEQLSPFPILGPSLTDWGAYNALGSIHNWADIGNLHNYLANHNPETGGWGDYGYGSLGYHKMLMSIMMPPDTPLVTTETGYGSNELDDATISKYLVRLLLYQFMNGVSRTYIHELVDEPGQIPFQAYGIVRADGTPKPAYYAIQNLLSALADPGPAFTPERILYKIDDGSIYNVMFQNREGENYLILWSTASSPIEVGVEVLDHIIDSGMHWLDDGMVENFDGSDSDEMNLSIDDRITLLRIIQ